ncbi:MAG: T9SS type A sorting domain-containing protein, partial [Lewinella sp.]|nr:T9SS type A sorting domain-containing protein [Lewinella sp.]
DNELAASWIAGVEPSGIFISGTEVLGSPGAFNDCDPTVNPNIYPEYPIGLVSTVDANGLIDSANALAQLTGIVHGVNLRSGGLEFFIIDTAGDGIGVFSESEAYGYTVTEGDEVTVQGVIGQYNGLGQIYADSVWMVSAGNMLQEAQEVTVLDESTEAQLVRLPVDAIENVATAGGGLNVTVSVNGTSTLLRIDFETNITEAFINGLSGSTFLVTGLGGQFDSSEPYTEGYQLLPRYTDDFEIIESTDEPGWGAEVRLYPNPVGSVLNLQAPVAIESVEIRNAYGQQLLRARGQGLSQQVSTIHLPAGWYTVSLISEGERVVRRFLKQ